MPELARRSSPDPAPDDDPERKPDPRASGWADVQDAQILNSQATRLAVEDVRRAVEDVRRAVEELKYPPYDRRDLDAAVEKLDAAVEMNALTVRVMESLNVIAGRCEFGEAVVEAERARGFAEGVEWCKARRCRLGVIDGGREG